LEGHGADGKTREFYNGGVLGGETPPFLEKKKFPGYIHAPTVGKPLDM